MYTNEKLRACVLSVTYHIHGSATDDWRGYASNRFLVDTLRLRRGECAEKLLQRLKAKAHNI